MMMSYGFTNKLNLHRIFAGVASMNPASQKMCEKAGLLVEGCQRQHLLRNRERHDRTLMGALRPEWIQSHACRWPGTVSLCCPRDRCVTPGPEPAGPATVVALVAHDAGGAEILSSYALQQGASSFLYALEGPAAGIFSRKLGAVEVPGRSRRGEPGRCRDLWNELAVRPGKSGPPAWRKRWKRSSAFLDHRTHYRERFVRSGDVVLPDEMWAGDTMADKLRWQHFPGYRCMSGTIRICWTCSERCGRRWPRPCAYRRA